MGEILPLAVAALSGSTLGAVLSYWTSRRKAPVERDSAHAAAAAELSEAAAGMIEPLTAEVKRLDARVQRAEIYLKFGDYAEAMADYSILVCVPWGRDTYYAVFGLVALHV